MKNKLENRAKQLINKLNTVELANFAKTAPIEILDLVLNELENRMPEAEFIALCETL